ncbi:MAG TPA: hypothetical protein VMM54_02280 [Nitrospirota bacterium]|nr:hypothetical protein [Nitrospirota bacterium]
MKTNLAVDCPSCSSVAPSPAASDRDVRLTQWPIQIKLVGTVAPFLQDADILVAADCTAFATPGFHEKFLPGRKVLIGCPKLDDAMQYLAKFTEIFSTIAIKRVTCLRMEVPCCGGMTAVLKEAITRSGKNIHLIETIVGVKGDVLSEKSILN